MHGDVNYNPRLIYHHLQSQEELFAICVWVFFCFGLCCASLDSVSFIVQGKRSAGDLIAALK